LENCLNFVEFEYVLNLDSNSNLLKRKFEKLFYFPSAARNQFRPTSHWQPSSVPFISFVFISVPAQSPSAFRPVTGSIPSSFSSFGRTTTQAGTAAPHALGRRLASRISSVPLMTAAPPLPIYFGNSAHPM
jgi:hypothetical protein